MGRPCRPCMRGRGRSAGRVRWPWSAQRLWLCRPSLRRQSLGLQTEGWLGRTGGGARARRGARSGECADRGGPGHALRGVPALRAAVHTGRGLRPRGEPHLECGFQAHGGDGGGSFRATCGCRRAAADCLGVALGLKFFRKIKWKNFRNFSRKNKNKFPAGNLSLYVESTMAKGLEGSCAMVLFFFLATD